MLIQLTYASRTSRVLGPADIKDFWAHRSATMPVRASLARCA